jgi:hypothetical protein
MKRKIFYEKRAIFIPFAVAALLALVSLVVMELWNNLLPAILHVGVITYWQAMGIFILCKILFGFGKGGRGFGGPKPWMRHRIEERFNQMTPEEKEKFKQKWNEKCGFGHRRGRGFGADWESYVSDKPAASEEGD